MSRVIGKSDEQRANANEALTSRVIPVRVWLMYSPRHRQWKGYWIGMRMMFWKRVKAYPYNQQGDLFDYDYRVKWFDSKAELLSALEQQVREKWHSSMARPDERFHLDVEVGLER